MSGESAADSVREAFQGRRGKILLVGGGVAVAAYVIWTRRTGTPEPVPGDELGDGLTPVPGPGGRSPQTDPTVGNDNQGSITPRRPTTNAEWLTAGVDFLVGRGVSGAAAQSALTKALGGQAVTTQETAWVSQVIGALGSPPEGMPPLGSSPADPNPQAPATLPAPLLHHVTTTSTTAKMSWNPVPGAKNYIVYRTGGVSRAGVAGTSYTFTGLRPNTDYGFQVAAVSSSGRRGALSANVHVRTRK